MPIVRVTLAEGRTSAQKKSVALEITDSIARHCNVHKEHIYVLFDDLSADDWTVGGETIAERKAKRGED
ncbi:tautomerase family protein [Rhodobacteraceae bacterium nBUS_24]